VIAFFTALSRFRTRCTNAEQT